MEDSDVRGIILQRAYDDRHKNGGRITVTDNDFGEQLSRDQIFNAARYLAEKGLITWQPVLGGTPTIGHALIKADGMDAVDMPGRTLGNIRLPKRVGIIGVEAKGAAGEIRGQPYTNATIQYASVAPIPPVTENIQAGVASASGVATASGVGEAVQEVAGRIAAQPQEARTAIRTLLIAINSQIADMEASKPNEPSKLQAYESIIHYLETSKEQLAQAADNIDKAIAEGGNTPEPFFTDEAAKIIVPLKNAFAEWLTDNRTAIVGFAISLTLFAAGYHFLKIFGIDGGIPQAVNGLLAAAFQYASQKKKN